MRAMAAGHWRVTLVTCRPRHRAPNSNPFPSSRVPRPCFFYSLLPNVFPLLGPLMWDTHSSQRLIIRVACDNRAVTARHPCLCRGLRLRMVLGVRVDHAKYAGGAWRCRAILLNDDVLCGRRVAKQIGVRGKPLNVLTLLPSDLEEPLMRIVPTRVLSAPRSGGRVCRAEPFDEARIGARRHRRRVCRFGTTFGALRDRSKEQRASGLKNVCCRLIPRHRRRANDDRPSGGQPHETHRLAELGRARRHGSFGRAHEVAVMRTQRSSGAGKYGLPSCDTCAVL